MCHRSGLQEPIYGAASRFFIHRQEADLDHKVNFSDDRPATDMDKLGDGLLRRKAGLSPSIRVGGQDVIYRNPGDAEASAIYAQDTFAYPILFAGAYAPDFAIVGIPGVF